MEALKLIENPVSSTDLARWRLRCKEGEHWWTFIEKDEAEHSPQSFAEKTLLGLNADQDELPVAEDFTKAAYNGYKFFEKLQLDDGHWACAYGGPSFLLAGMIFAMYITDTTVPGEWKIEITRYLANTVNLDGGWGMHEAGESTLFATVLYYVSLRILGLVADHILTRDARRCIQSLGGTSGLPQWGKAWLACLNLYGWNGINPIPEELWLLPDWVPFHPWRFWVQCRVVYLPLSYLWTNQKSIPLDPFLKQLRKELYESAYDDINFEKYRDFVAVSDCAQKPSIILWIMNHLLWIWVYYFRPAWVVEKANKRVAELIKQEDENTHYNCIAPVSKAFHMVAIWHLKGPESGDIERHRNQITPYMWLGENGMCCTGTNGVQVWDTAFCIQALAAIGLAEKPEFRKSVQKGLDFLEMSQIREDLTDPYRQKRKGGWPFSTRSNGYIVSDCSAESLKAVLMLQNSGFPQIISDTRIKDCMNSTLELQNADGGFGTYERQRASPFLEYINPSEVFDSIMVEYSYPECTSAVITALQSFKKYFPEHRPSRVSSTLKSALSYLHRSQRKDGSWYGSWGICFTYATFFSLQALQSVDEIYQTSARVRKSCKWLLSKQVNDGGWGEHYTSCEQREYIHHSKSQVVNTAWAVLALMYAGCPDQGAIERALELIKSRQQRNGEWVQEDIEGVFNRTCMIGYPNYKYYFSIWALGYFSHEYKPRMLNIKKVASK